MIRRLLLLVAGTGLAYYAVRFGHTLPPQLPQNPDTLSELWQQIKDISTPMAAIARLAIAGTLIAIPTLFFGKLARKEAAKVYTGATGVAWTMVVLVLSAFAFGVFANPLQFGSSPLQWWDGLDSEWLAVGIIALVPTALLLVSLVYEIVALLAGRYTDNVLLERTASQTNVLADNLQTHRTNLGYWMKGVDESLDNSAKTLAGIGTSLAEHRGADLDALKTKLDEVLNEFKSTPDDKDFGELKQQVASLGQEVAALAERLPAAEGRRFLPEEVPSSRAAE